MSDTPKHTPGPWVWTGQYGRSNLFGADSELVLFEVGGLYCRGDALLIAAAPDMLEHLKFAYAVFSEFINHPDCPEWGAISTAHKRFEATIAKAEGRQHG